MIDNRKRSSGGLSGASSGASVPSAVAAKRLKSQSEDLDEFDLTEELDDEPDEFIPDDVDAIVVTPDGYRPRFRYCRQKLPDGGLQPQSTALVFQQLEVDYVQGPPNVQHNDTSLSDVPVVRMFGVTQEGHSVCAFVHGFEPYFYVEAPTHFGPDDCEALRVALNTNLAQHVRAREDKSQACVRVDIVRRQTIMHYQPAGKVPFLKVVLAGPQLVTKAKAILETSGMSLETGITLRPGPTYESNVLFVMRYMVDTDIVGAGWVELPPKSYTVVKDEGQKKSTCQIEVHVNYKSVIGHAPEGEWSRLAPIRILSVDIECASAKGFPQAARDPVIMIATQITEQGRGTVAKNVLVLGTCSHIPGVDVDACVSETELLCKWRDLVADSDPDILIGYNICNFDLPYLMDRAAALRLESFATWGRSRNKVMKMRDAMFSSKAYGTHEYKELLCDGRIQFDLLMAMQRDHKLSSYSLNSVCSHFLGEQKEDVHHNDINTLWKANAESRRRLAVYCMKDAYLPQRLVDKLMYMYNMVEMARVTGVPVSYLLTKGQSVKVFSQILRKAKQTGLVVPNMKPSNAGGKGDDAVGYEGATVLEPKQGFYRTPVATLDFASLYPSIMMAHNLCYSTLIPKGRERELPPEHVTRTPSGDHFVKPALCKGILPEILEELLGARKRAKSDLKAATDPFVKAVLDGRQLALKVSANSVYGFTGATVGKMPCLEISASVTSFGRQMIEHTKNMVEKQYCKENGYSHDADVIYGDTDSVMVLFGVKDIESAMALGQEAASLVTKTFIKPIKLEFEKVYYPYLLINKKRYAGLLWTKPDRYDKMDTKGIETVRRDNCLLVRNVVSRCLEKILIEQDEQGAVDFVKQTVADLLMNRLDLSLLVITKGLTQDADDYGTKAPHVEVAKKMQKRDPATAPTIGDRVAYVNIKARKGAQAWEKAEDPIYALEHNLPIDAQHYLDHHLEKPLSRLFGPILKDYKVLLTGDHTRSRVMATPSSAAGGIMKFAKVRLTCMGCRAALEDEQTTLCRHCSMKESDIYAQKLTTVNELEEQFGALWTQCQRCQGSLHYDVICVNRDCPIFYRRTKVQKDLGEATSSLARFQDW